MDFFEAQARARRRTTRLVALFVLAVIGTIAAGYAAALLVLGQRFTDRPVASLWQPDLFAGVTLGTLAVVSVASLSKWLSLRQGGPAVAAMVGGRRVNAGTVEPRERRLINVVEEMAIASGVPLPAVYVLDDEPGINAFAAGLTTSDAVVAVTRGALEKLSRDELQGVIGHEFSHILNGDMRMNLRLTALLFGILVIALIGRGFLRGAGRFRPRGNSRNAGGAVAFTLALGLALTLVGYVGYFFGRLIQAAVSRQREFLADASAVQFTRNPAGIAGALRKIGGYALGGALSGRHTEEIRHFYFAQGFRSAFGGLFATHPPLPERIRALEPTFDGKFYEPKTTVDVERESFRTAGVRPRPPPLEAAAAAFAATPAVPPPLPPRTLPFEPARVRQFVGRPSSEQVTQSQRILARIPERLRDAAHSPAEAPAVVLGLILAASEPTAELGTAVRTAVGESVFAPLIELQPAISALPRADRLPLLQLALPGLASHQGPALDRIIERLDAVMQADGKISLFEFALQKVVIHHLDQGRNPSGPPARRVIGTDVNNAAIQVLSAVAGQNLNPAAASRAFAAAVARFAPAQAPLAPIAEAARDLAALDRALETLTTRDATTKARLLEAAAQVVTHDGQVAVEEYELLRAIAAVLDCPLPPLAEP